MNVSQVRKEFGKCLELVSMDPNFHEISVGLFVKKNILTVWSYSKKEGIEDRLNQIRDKMVDFGALERSDSDFKLVIPEGALIERPLKFLFVKSVEMKPDSKTISMALSCLSLSLFAMARSFTSLSYVNGYNLKPK